MTMHTQLALACRRARFTPVALPKFLRVVIRDLSDRETAIPITNIKAEIIFLSNDGTPTESEALQKARVLTAGLIQHVVANHYGKSRVDLISARRTAGVMWPRQIAMYLAKTMTTRSYGEIGVAFRRDHTTIMWGVDKIEGLVSKDPIIAAEVAALKIKIEEMTR